MAELLEKKIKVVFAPEEKKPFLVIYKPQGLASAPLKENDECALNQAIELFPSIKNVHGKKTVEYGLIHRIDTETEGLLLIALDQEFYDEIQKEQKNGQFIKYYRAKIDTNENISKEFTITSKFRTFGPKGKFVKCVFENGSTADKKKCSPKIYSTHIKINGKEAVCSIKEGFRHQVRVHLATSGFPIKGDKLYNPDAKENEKMQFCAFGIEFVNPLTNEKLSFQI